MFSNYDLKINFHDFLVCELHNCVKSSTTVRNICLCLTYQDTQLCVSGQERHKMHSVLFTGRGKFLILTSCISETTQWTFINFTYFMLYIHIHDLKYQI